MTLLKVENLVMYFETFRGFVHAVEDVTFELEKGESLGLAGESGCGKTSTALSILRLLPHNGKIMKGRIIFEGQDLLQMSDEQFDREVRWKKMSIVFQGAMNALHPIFNVGDQIAEAVMLHSSASKKEALDKAGRLLDLVGVKAERLDRYPHELSGGMKQRAVIAMALASDPHLVIADEPTTALDVIVQAQVLQVIKSLREKLNLSMIAISHDLSILAETCDKVAIMYAGKIVEIGRAVSMFKNPLHPYNERLIKAFPSVIGKKREIVSIPGFPPNLLKPPTGCRFHTRCPYATDVCKKEEPELLELERNHFVACHIICR